jgi:hypothetical protein
VIWARAKPISCMSVSRFPFCILWVVLRVAKSLMLGSPARADAASRAQPSEFLDARVEVAGGEADRDEQRRLFAGELLRLGARGELPSHGASLFPGKAR